MSVFRVNGSELTLTARTSSGGQRPVSVTLDRDLVYVLNAGGAVGGADNIAGFRLDSHGRLLAIPGAVQALSGPNTAPAQIGFTTNGEFLVVTERATNLIAVFSLIGDEDGSHTRAHSIRRLVSLRSALRSTSVATCMLRKLPAAPPTRAASLHTRSPTTAHSRSFQPPCQRRKRRPAGWS